jgi:hypothetical protein
MRRTLFLAILVPFLVLGCSTLDEELPDDLPDEPLDWDLDDDEMAAAPVCPPDEPECDALHEADVELEDEPEAATYGLTDPKTASGSFRAWPGGRIPYRFATGSNAINATTRDRLSQGMTNWEKLTEGRIKFRAATSSDTAYVLVKRGSTRVSPFVGYRAGRVQELYLRDNEYLTVIKHELGHVLGFHHEQRRTDRGNHIQVRTANIVDSAHCRYQFSKCTDCERLGPYDRTSVMHYRTHDLSGCRTGPVLLKLDGTTISHTWKISPRDLDAVAAMYDPVPAPPPPADASLPETGSLTAAGGLCADVAGGSTLDGATVLSWTCHGGGNQDWRATKNRQLRAKHSLRCMEVAGAAKPGARVEQAACADTLEQKWRFADMEIVNGATGKCLEIPNGNYASGQRVGYATCNATKRQRFTYRPHQETILAGGLCLTARPDADVVLRPCDGRTSQRWFQGRGGFVSRSHSGQCLRVEGGAKSGTRIEVRACNDQVGQRWALRGEIRDRRAGLCLRGGERGTPLALASCDGSSPQRWTFWSR